MLAAILNYLVHKANALTNHCQLGEIVVVSQIMAGKFHTPYFSIIISQQFGTSVHLGKKNQTCTHHSCLITMFTRDVVL